VLLVPPPAFPARASRASVEAGPSIALESFKVPPVPGEATFDLTLKRGELLVILEAIRLAFVPRPLHHELRRIALPANHAH
jgi:hypothetical protein